ncbi:uncharacterized protein LOC120126866 [Hibiscus syriacus]|uniref:uncharacterized protein LOC120126866 n=1 Tax=Hibiscus syriacus TaxID=106335 RepID=UPI0019234DF4|nr:uncharacterized protein LOC120126866 [Hibiscus syriacus]
MLPQQWASQCGNHCTKKYTSLTEIPWRVFCKKGCDNDADTWEECISECTDLCYKAPVLKDQQWSSYIDRSPGAVKQSEECYSACLAGCGYKLELCKDDDDEETQTGPSVEKPLNQPTSRPGEATKK